MYRGIALQQGTRDMGRIIMALLLREIRVRFGRRRIGYAWALIEPMIHVGTLYALRGAIGGFSPASIPLLLWLIVGIIPFLMFRNIVSRASGVARGNQDVLILPPVQLTDVIVAQILLEFMTCCITLIISLLLYAAIIGPVHIDDPLAILGCLALLAVMGFGFGMLTCVFTSIFPSTAPLVAGMLRIIYFASGAIFSISRLPEKYHAYLTWNPLLHIFESLHGAAFHVYDPISDASNLGYATVCAAVMLLFGYTLLQRFRQQITER